MGTSKDKVAGGRRAQAARRLALALAAAGLAAFAAQARAQAAAEPVMARIKSTGTVTIAHRESSIPFSYVDNDKKPVGYAVELCQRLVGMLEKELKTKLKIAYLQVTPANRIDMIAQGKADMECGSTTNNAERRQKVAFTVPHYITGAKLMVRADSPVTRFEDLEGMKLVSTKGTTPMKIAQEQVRVRMLRIRVLEADDHAKAVTMVEEGDADGFLMDDVLLYGLRANRPKPEALKVVGNFLTIEPLAIMISKDDATFKRLIDEEMRRIVVSGEVNKVYSKWFEQPIPPKGVNLQLPMNYLMRDFYKYPSDKVPF
jgi:glutamate/aspartate transport system substrate-binding protein